MYMTLKDAAAKAGIHENTARFYRDKYEEYFPFTGEGRNRRYAPATIDILRKIKSSYDSGLDACAVREQLILACGEAVAVKHETTKSPGDECPALDEKLQAMVRQYVDQSVKTLAADFEQKMEWVKECEAGMKKLDKQAKERKPFKIDCGSCQKHAKVIIQIEGISTEIKSILNNITALKEEVLVAQAAAADKFPLNQGNDIIELLQMHHSQINEIIKTLDDYFI